MSNPSQPDSVGNLSVASEEIGQVAQYLTDLTQVFRSSIDAASRDVDGLKTSWTGTAADNFSKKWLGVFEQSSPLLSSLSELATSLDFVAEEFVQQDDSSAGSISSLNLDYM
ncbi:WXG100 family type VII secretion target [Nocardia fluminea]|uniref:WXG100 family type VII secretion target n=1 Tax=Nocardia fluminea TaxID=134984 RepID=UPI00342F76C3